MQMSLIAVKCIFPTDKHWKRIKKGECLKVGSIKFFLFFTAVQSADENVTGGS